MDEFAVKIARRLKAIEDIALKLRDEDGDLVLLYVSARVLLDEIQEDVERFPAPEITGEKLISMRRHLGTLAGLDHYELPQGRSEHLVNILNDSDTVRRNVLRH